MIADEVRRMIDGFAEFLPAIREMAPAEFDAELARRVEAIDEASFSCPEDRPALMRYCFEKCAAEMDKGKVLRHARHKPFGYAGDFMVIDYMYQNSVGADGDGRFWDSCFQRLPAVQAVRYRKKLFHQFCAERRTLADGAFRAISIGRGPCRDICEALCETGPDRDKMYFHCVDIDGRAVAYARELLAAHRVADRVEFEVKNALLLRSGRTYDLAWCGGLFDYLNNRQAVRLLRRMWMLASPWRGQVVFGNFHPENPTRAQMEWIGAWFLIYRDEEELRGLCDRAGIPPDRVEYQLDPYRCIGYIIAKRDA